MKTRRIAALALALAVAAFALAACNKYSSPTATMKAFYEAAKNKDVAAAKKTFSKNTLKSMDDSAKKLSSTTDEMISKSMFSDVPPTMPETRNEKIDGDKATLEMKNEKGTDWSTIHFVKEDGDWKISLEDMFKS